MWCRGCNRFTSPHRRGEAAALSRLVLGSLLTSPRHGLPDAIRGSGPAIPMGRAHRHSLSRAGEGRGEGRLVPERMVSVPPRRLHLRVQLILRFKAQASFPPPCGEGWLRSRRGGGVSATLVQSSADTPTSSSSPQGGGELLGPPRDNVLILFLTGRTSSAISLPIPARRGTRFARRHKCRGRERACRSAYAAGRAGGPWQPCAGPSLNA